MPDDRMALMELVDKQVDGDLVREMLAFAAERMMEAEVEARMGAAKGVRPPLRDVQRNGYRDRDWDTRAGLLAHSTEDGHRFHVIVGIRSTAWWAAIPREGGRLI